MIWSTRLLALAALVVAVAVAAGLRDRLQVEADPESVRRFVAELGWLGPVAFVALFLLRSALLIPTVILLTAGGVGFGIALGTLLGALGLTVSAAAKLGIAHVVGRDALLARVPTRLRERLAYVQHDASRGFIGLVTAYPIGPAEAVHLAAIVAGMSAAPFLGAVFAGALVRAGCFSLFGNALVAGSGLVAATAILTLLALVPLAFPRVRRQLLVRSP